MVSVARHKQERPDAQQFDEHPVQSIAQPPDLSIALINANVKSVASQTAKQHRNVTKLQQSERQGRGEVGLPRISTFDESDAAGVGVQAVVRSTVLDPLRRSAIPGPT